MTDPYQNLANAIILTAVKDWRSARRKLKRKPKNKDHTASFRQSSFLCKTTHGRE